MSTNYNNTVEGEYKTPVKKKPYYVKVINGDFQCFTGNQFNKKPADKKGNVVFRDGMKLIENSTALLKNSSNGLLIGSILGNSSPNSFEDFLRSHSNVHKLGSFFPPILVKLGYAEYFRPDGERKLWIRAKRDSQKP